MRFGCALGEIYGPDRKFGLWGRSGGWHILQGREDSRWADVQNAAYGQLRDALIMGVGHMQWLESCRRAWRRRQGGCGWLLWTRLRRVGVSAASLDGPRTSTAQWATARSCRTARIGRQLGRRKACGRAHFWPRGAEYASTRMVPRGGDAGRSVVDAQRGRLSSCWLCQLAALDLGGGLVLLRRGVGEWAWAFESNEG